MNNIFKTLYGISPDAIQETVVIMPFDVPRAAVHLGVERLINGRLFACGQCKGFTLIRSGMGAGFVGDCVLWLERTPCRQILFLGTCGLIEQTQQFDIGSVLTPKTVHIMESFSDIVRGHIKTPEVIAIDDHLIDPVIPRTNCISFASLHEETKCLALFKKLNAHVIEMECAGFFLSSQRIHRASGILLVVSDIVADENMCFNLSPENKKKLSQGIHQACAAIARITRPMH